MQEVRIPIPYKAEGRSYELLWSSFGFEVAHNGVVQGISEEGTTKIMDAIIVVIKDEIKI